MNKLEKLAEQAPALEFNQDDGTPIVKLGLIVTLFFKEGYTQASKQRVVACFERFYSELGGKMQASTNGRVQKLTQSAFEKIRGKILTSEPNEQYYWCLSSAAETNEAEIHSLSVLNSHEIHGDRYQSYIKLVLPWTLLAEPGGVARYQQWLTYLCNQVGTQHGYGGLSCILPIDYDSYMPIEYQLAQRYSGLEVDSMPFASTTELLNHIKGVNWFTVLGDAYVERLGGEAAIRRALVDNNGVLGDEIELTRYERGLIIRAGSYPELGAVADGPPVAYVAVNRVVKPLRIPNPDQLHTYSPYGDCFEQESTERWYARFDEPALTPAGQPCPLTGYWQVPAHPDSRRYVKEGDTMLRYHQIGWDDSVWQWVGKE